MAVSPLPDLPDGILQKADFPGQRPGEHQAQNQHHHADDGGEPQQVPLEALQQGGLLRIVLIGVHRPDDLVLVQHRPGRPAAESPPPVGAGVGVIPQEGLDKFRIKAVLPHGAAGLPGVVKDLTGAVRHQNPGQGAFLRHRQGCRHILLVQLVQPGEGVHHHGHAALQGSLLGPEHQILRNQQRVGVQQQQHRGNDQDIADAEFKLEAGEERRLTL